MFFVIVTSRNDEHGQQHVIMAKAESESEARRVVLDKYAIFGVHIVAILNDSFFDITPAMTFEEIEQTLTRIASGAY